MNITHFAIAVMPQNNGGFTVINIQAKPGGGFNFPNPMQGTVYNGSPADNELFKADHAAYVDNPDGHKWSPPAQPAQLTPEEKQAKIQALGDALVKQRQEAAAKAAASNP